MTPIDAPDLIGQDFTAAAPDTRWCAGITYVRTVDGWVDTATVIDLRSCKVVGYAVADHLRTSLIIEALAAALLTRKPPTGVIFHSDRGCQYTYKKELIHTRPWRDLAEGRQRTFFWIEGCYNRRCDTPH
jgi:putative transposase